jgi:hypothetical protein
LSLLAIDIISYALGIHDSGDAHDSKEDISDDLYEHRASHPCGWVKFTGDYNVDTGPLDDLLVARAKKKARKAPKSGKNSAGFNEDALDMNKLEQQIYFAILRDKVLEFYEVEVDHEIKSFRACAHACSSTDSISN